MEEWAAIGLVLVAGQSDRKSTNGSAQQFNVIKAI